MILDNEHFLVRDFDASRIELEGSGGIILVDLPEDSVGKIYYWDGNENFDPESPGASIFNYICDGQSSFQVWALSVNSHWKPTQEQMSKHLKVVNIAERIFGVWALASIELSDGTKISTRANKTLTWTNVGNRWVKVRDDVYVDLDSSSRIEPLEQGRLEWFATRIRIGD